MPTMNKPLLEISPPEDKIPIQPVVAIGLCLCLETLNIALINPYAPYLARYYLPDIEAINVGYYSGYIISAFSLGNIIGSIFWGWFADRYGRKKTVLYNIIAMILLTCVFAVSKNYWLSLFIRFLVGMFDGLLTVGKTLMSEVCPPNLISKGFSYFMIFVGLGNIFGPYLGGYLIELDKNQPDLIKLFPFLSYTPVVTLCLFIIFVAIISLIFACLWIYETLPSLTVNVGTFAALPASVSGSVSVTPTRHSFSSREYIEKQSKEGGYIWLLKNKTTFLPVLLYGTLAFAQISHDSLFSLFVMNPTDHHGFGYGQEQIGLIMTCTAPFSAIIAPILFPSFSYLLSHTQIYAAFSYLYALTSFLYPLVPYSNQLSETWQWFFNIVGFGLLHCIRILAFSSSNVLLSNSVLSPLRGKINGLGNVSGSLGRFLGPFIFSTVFTWSNKVNSFPIDYSLSYLLIGIFTILTSSLVFLLPNSINIPKELEKQYNNSQIDVKSYRSSFYSNKSLLSLISADVNLNTLELERDFEQIYNSVHVHAPHSQTPSPIPVSILDSSFENDIEYNNNNT